MMRLLNQRLSNPQKIVLSFLFVIFIGSLLLSLPISQLPTSQATYIDNLFISVSAVCVTGLFTQSIAESYTLFGQVVMMALIQVGGLGLMTIIGLIYFRIGQKIRLSNQLALADALNKESVFDTKDFIANIFKYTAIIEGIGALLFATYFIPHLGWFKGTFTALFMAVSAFCNAGFDPLSNLSMVPYQTVPVINWTIMLLIVLGGIGYSVWFDISHQIRHFNWRQPRLSLRLAYKRLHIHSKLALLMTAILILIGAFLFCLVEWRNTQTIGQLSIGDKIMTGFFQTITMRTAGFASIDYTLAKPISLLIFIVTMFIGGSPGSTAGGLKTTTFALVLMMAWAEIKQSEPINFAKRTIPRPLVRKAFVIFMLYVSLLVIGSGLILGFDPGTDYLYILFESVSAIATVGVTANLTTDLSTASHIVIMLMMFIGRIGPMTMFLSLRFKNDDKTEVNYARGNILIG